MLAGRRAGRRWLLVRGWPCVLAAVAGAVLSRRGQPPRVLAVLAARARLHAAPSGGGVLVVHLGWTSILLHGGGGVGAGCLNAQL